MQSTPDTFFRVNNFTKFIQNMANVYQTPIAIFGEEEEELNKYSHKNRIIEIIHELIPTTPTLLLKSLTRSVAKHGVKIMNLSLGIVDDNTIFTADTKKTLKKHINNNTLESFLSNYMEINNESQQENFDEYFIYKHKEALIELYQTEYSAERFIMKFSQYLTKIYETKKIEITNQLLNGDFLVVQALANGGEDQLDEHTNTFYGIDMLSAKQNAKRRESVIFVKSLYIIEDRSEYFLPTSQVPGLEYAERTLSVVIPVSARDPFDKSGYNRDVSENSFATPWVVAAAARIVIARINSSMRPLTTAELADCLLKTATPISDVDICNQNMVHQGDIKAVCGVGILNADAALKMGLSIDNTCIDILMPSKKILFSYLNKQATSSLEKLEDHYIIENRHKSTIFQKEYDRRHGIIIK